MNLLPILADVLADECPTEHNNSLSSPLNSPASGEVQVFRLDVERWAGCDLVRLAYAALTDGERARAEGFRRSVSRAEFIAGRGCLRLILAAYAGNTLMPQSIPIEVGRHGKPQIAYAAARRNNFPAFNVAHSNGRVLLAFSSAGAVGIDVEYMDASIEPMEIAEASFSAAEIAFLQRAATERDRLLAFYACWTRKEAVAKADGRGLTLAVQNIPVFAANPKDSSVRLSHNPGHEDENCAGQQFFVREIDAGSNYLAAVATVVQPRETTVRDLRVQDFLGKGGDLRLMEVPAVKSSSPLVLSNPNSVTYRSEVLSRWGMQVGTGSRTLQR